MKKCLCLGRKEGEVNDVKGGLVLGKEKGEALEVKIDVWLDRIKGSWKGGQIWWLEQRRKRSLS